MSDTILDRTAETRLARLDTIAWNPVLMTEPDAARVTDELQFVQSIKHGVSAARESVLAPLRTRLNELRVAYDTVLQRIATTEAALKSVLLGYRAARQRAAEQAAYEAAQAQAQLAAAEARQDAEHAGLPSADAALLARQVHTEVAATVSASIAPAPAPNVTQGLLGTTHVQRTWTYEVVDPALIPREYLAVDGPAIQRAVRGGARAIPGVRIYERETLVGRAAR
jgi:hypothetical protein